MPRFYLTTAIDYANGDPHLGHALEKIGADVIARYRRLCGYEVHLLIGMDEHGQKVQQTAAKEGVAPQAFTDEIAGRFQAMWARLGVGYDQFIRTTEAHHKAGVKALIERIAQQNPDDFYERSYRGMYCVGCEAFKQDADIDADGKCVLHTTRVLEEVEERNWFFRLSKYQDYLRELLTTNPSFCEPESRRNEILGLLNQGLEDISASRSRLEWAVPFPLTLSNGETQGTYVWFDALPNYLTATGFPDAGYEARWPADLHIIGKDITRFHVVIWPAMLKAAGLPLPRQVWAHGFVQLGGERFSKSAGVKLDLGEAIDRFGADAFRYVLLREVPFDGDGNFSWERFEERYTSDLANAFGNLASRAMAMVEKYFDGVVPSAARPAEEETDDADLAAYHAAMHGEQGWLLHDGLSAVYRMTQRANEYTAATAPWAVAKDETRRGELEVILASLIRRIARQTVLLAPFMPNKTQQVWAQLGAPGQVADQRFDTLGGLDVSGWRVQKGEPLFPRPA
ncbi:methionine--tRNA ligase [Gemmatimonas sp.]|jgi:methionyl-tRNA synthetase|uniref:methionine--tRNA ligase n=1 Tax=Gemmatimonas sp. TaxID=1962908 RepID=UPI0037BE2319